MTTPNRFISGAVDLGEIKARAEAKAQADAHKQSGSTSRADGITPVTLADINNAEDVIIERSFKVPVIVLVGSDRSPASTQVRSDLENLAYGADFSWLLVYIDADKQGQLAAMLGVQAAPTVIAMAGGKPITSFQGAQSLESLQQFTVSVVKACAGKLEGLKDSGDATTPQGDPIFDPIDEALRSNDLARAHELVDKAAESVPSNPKTKRYVSLVALKDRISEIEDPKSLVQGAAAKDLATTMQAVDLMVDNGRGAEGLAILNNALVCASGEDKKTIRARLLDLFALFAPDDPIVLSARAQMASALF